MKEKELAKLREKFGGLVKMPRLPDAIFVSSAKESILAIREAQVMKIKVAGVVNTESDPNQIEFPIAANDNARRSLELIIKSLKDSLKK